ncbi:MAG: RES family NAD+ phosphorylase [Bacteroidota bacterium]
MIVYRLTKSKYANTLKSSGTPNRWNRAHEYVIYTSSTVSLCALELLAHTSGVRPAGSYKMMKIEIDDSVKLFEVLKQQLLENWNSLAAYHTTQMLGNQWYVLREYLILKVPSAIIPSEYNFVINTLHPAFGRRVKIKEVDDFFWDRRFPVS